MDPALLLCVVRDRVASHSVVQVAEMTGAKIDELKALIQEHK